MRKLLKYSSIIIFFLFLYSCEKESNSEKNFIGSWQIIIPDNDTLTFIDEFNFRRKYSDGIEHSFKYNTRSDSITIQYNGPNLILVQPTTHHYEINDNEVIINFGNGCYGFKTEKYFLTRL